MKTKNKSHKDIQIAYIGGGSRGWAWGLMSDLAAEQELSGSVKLYDIQYESAESNAIIGNRLSAMENTQGKWHYSAEPTLEAALEGADFIIISILPGSFAEMKSDVHLPEEYGIYQSVGDTVGPGGLVRALRAIPLYVEIANAIKQYAPQAWVINYTNPMTLCTRTLYEVFPGVKAIGCCHEVFGTQHMLASMVEKKLGLAKVDRRDIKVNVMGINHFTWLDRASYQNIDLFPMYREFVEEHYEEGYEGNEKGHWLNDHFSSAQRVKFDLFRKYGIIAAAGDRHLAEFMPGNHYLKDPETVKSWKFSLTNVDWRIKNREELYAKGQRLASGEESFVVKPTGEEGIDMIKAILGMGEFITNVNMPNRGQMEGLPAEAVVETNAAFGYDHVSPIVAGKLPPAVQELVMKHVANQEMTLQAALKQDKALAFKAFMNDPLVRLSDNSGAELFNKMLQNTKALLPGWEL